MHRTLMVFFSLGMWMAAARLSGDQLTTSLIAAGPDKKPDLSKTMDFVFARQGGSATAGSAPRNPLASRAPEGAADPWVGTFSDGRIKLDLSGGRGSYTGKIHFEGETYPLFGRSGDGRTMEGEFTSGDDSFNFEASLEGTTLMFTTTGTTYKLQKTAVKAPTSRLATRPGGQAAAAEVPVTGNVVDDPEWGIRFVAPEGWKAQKREGMIILGHTTMPGMILVFPHDFKTIEELREGANEPLYSEADGHLKVTGRLETLGNNLVAAEFGGTLEGSQVRGRVLSVISPNKGGMTIMAGAETRSYSPQYARWAESIARSVRFYEPQASPEVQQWAERLRGRRLAYMKSGGSTGGLGSHAWSDKKDIYLCSDGTFQASFSYMGSADTGGAYGSTAGRSGPQTGQWQVNSAAGVPGLELRYSSGEKILYKLSAQGSKTFLNGDRWFVVENDVCR